MPQDDKHPSPLIDRYMPIDSIQFNLYAPENKWVLIDVIFKGWSSNYTSV
jgi:hypothetical protein